MKRLAKVGFTQSYSYFTWRNTKAELTEYLTELTTSEMPRLLCGRTSSSTRPTSTRIYLQTSGRAGFQRPRSCWPRRSPATTASTAASSCARPTPVPGKEEYLELREIRDQGLGLGPARQHPRPTSACSTACAASTRRCRPSRNLTLLQRLERQHPLLRQDDAGEGRLPALRGQSRSAQRAAGAHFEVPLWEFGLPDDGVDRGEDLVTGSRFTWHGKIQHMLLDPQRTPLCDLAAHSAGSGTLMRGPGTAPAAERQARGRALRQRDGAIDRTQPDWYKDAVIYQLHVKAFHDANDDGIGDFEGLMQRLDYIESLGVTAIWLHAVLSLAAARRRLRHRRLPHDQSVLRHDARLPPLRRARRTSAASASSPSSSSTTPPTSIPGSSGRGAPSPARRRATSMSGATPTRRYTETRIIFIDTEKSNWTWDPVAQGLFLAPLLLAPAGPELRQSARAARRCCASCTTGSTWASTGCGSTPSPI